MVTAKAKEKTKGLTGREILREIDQRPYPCGEGKDDNRCRIDVCLSCYTVEKILRIFSEVLGGYWEDGELRGGGE